MTIFDDSSNLSALGGEAKENSVIEVIEVYIRVFYDTVDACVTMSS